MNKNIEIQSEGRLLAGELYLPPDAKRGIVIAHSFRNDRNEPVCSEAAKRFAEDNYAIISFDFVGHGKTGGGLENVCYRTLTEDMSAAIGFLKSEIGGNAIGVYAISLGAAAAVLSDNRAAAYVLLSPHNNRMSLLKRYKGQLMEQNKDLTERGYAVLDSESGRGQFKMGKEWIDEMRYGDLDLKVRYCNTPERTLLIQGTIDPLVSVKEVRDLQYNNSNFGLFVVPGADHNFTESRDRELVISVALAWFNRALRR